MGRWAGVYNTDKRLNKKIAMVLLGLLLLEGITFLPMLGLGLAANGILGIILVLFGAWMIYGFHKRKFA